VKRYLVFLLLIGLSAGPAAAQPGRPAPARVWDVNHNIWLCYFSDADLYRKWGLHTEFQYRRTHGLRDPQQYFYRAGVNYRPTKGVLLTAGYVYLLSLPYSEYPAAGRSHQHWLYELVQLNQDFGRLGLTHRFIQEQRWVRGPDKPSYAFEHRSRYRLALKLPLTQPHLVPGTLYALASDEIFIGYGHNAPGFFDENRLYGGLGYQFTKALDVEASYLSQILAHSDQVVYEDNRALEVSVHFNPDFRPRPVAPGP